MLGRGLAFAAVHSPLDSMRILLNTTTLTTGGALQLGTSIARSALADPEHEWHLACSAVLSREIARFCPGELPRTEIFERSPAVDRASRQRLAELEARIQPDCVFTPYGPSYVRFASPHLCGAASPWAAHASFSAYRALRFPSEWLTTFLLSVYRGYWFRQVDALVVETEYTAQGYARRVGFPPERIHVVPNTCGQHYLDQQTDRLPPRSDEKLRILCFAAPHKHKRVDFVADVASGLESLRPELDFEFVTTLDHQEGVRDKMFAKADRLRVRQRIRNLGPVPVADGPALYRSTHICFMPTVLECFSATYPEAMAMGLPIVTTDLGFVRDVCRDAALYFSPYDAHAAAKCILRLVDDQGLWSDLVAEGRRTLADLPSADDKFRDYTLLLQRLVATHGDSRVESVTSAARG